MHTLADRPQLVGFFSYSRDDDEDSAGGLSALRERVQRELRGQLGRSARDFRLWQDKEAIAPGTLWEGEIKTAIAQSVFFIPIITPTTARSKFCRFELEAFQAREQVLGRSDLVFPLLYIRVPELEDEARLQENPVLSMIAARQYVDWQSYRHSDMNSSAVKEAIAQLCRHIVETLSRPDQREAEQARLQQEEATAQRQVVEAEQRAKEQRRIAEEARLAEEEEQKRQLPGKRPSNPKTRWSVTAACSATVVVLAAIGLWASSPGVPSPAAMVIRPSMNVSQARLAALRTLPGHTDAGIHFLSFAPDGRTLASVSVEGVINLFDPVRGQFLRRLTDKSACLHCAAFSPDGQSLAFVAINAESVKKEIAVTIVPLNSGGNVSARSLPVGGSGVPYSLAFAPDGRSLALSGGEKPLDLWEVSQGSLRLTLQGHGAFTSIVFSPDGQMIAEAIGQVVLLRTASTGQLLRTLTGHLDEIDAVRFSPDGQTLASGGADHTIKLWNLASGEIRRAFVVPHGEVNAVAFSPDGRTLASGNEDHTITLFDASTGQLVQTLSGHDGQVYAIVFSPDGKILASAGDDSTIKLWAMANDIAAAK